MEQDHLMEQRAADVARGIIEASLYLVLATADESGRPWSSPVYFAHSAYARFYWVSAPDATHSRNLAKRPEVGISIFDSSAPIGTGQGVYLRAQASEISGDELSHGIEVFSRRSLTHGGASWAPADVLGETGMRLYQALVDDEYWILAKDGRPDHRVPVRLT
jgi:nitroimidazol reductase NimA-like FMN-containing flavoprotein (pyridoxamine 5'-phosphate oxidase superfamily)